MLAAVISSGYMCVMLCVVVCGPCCMNKGFYISMNDSKDKCKNLFLYWCTLLSKRSLETSQVNVLMLVKSGQSEVLKMFVD